MFVPRRREFNEKSLDQPLARFAQEVLGFYTGLSHHLGIVAMLQGDLVQSDFDSILRFVPQLGQVPGTHSEGWFSRSIENLFLRKTILFACVFTEF